ncbi:MAG: UDP-2,3-diacylglucosamine diphosphatase [bacterium]
METLYFISDVHLGAHSEDIEKLKISRLLSFLKSVRHQADYLYIVGDLYDFWFEYYKAIPKVNLKVLAALSDLVESGTVVRYFIGNHDLWHESYLESEIGVHIFHEPLETRHNTLKLFVAHGDGLADGEWKVRLIKRILKNRANIFLYRLLHPDLGIPLARLFSNRSKKKGANRFIDEYRKFAHAKLQDGFDAVILGHTHQPVFEQTDSKYYINLGDWVKNFTYVKMTGTSLELKTWHETQIPNFK